VATGTEALFMRSCSIDDEPMWPSQLL